MADIALLFAEEYERSVKDARKAGGAKGEYEIDFVSYAAALAKRVKTMIGHDKIELVKWVCEPKSQIGLAASNGFFSA
ncbi:RING/FYVE/PHD zinc finger superfamily protein [Fagus crenata]